MTRQFADYVYSNHDDTIRIRIFKTMLNEWDYDIFKKNDIMNTFSDEAGENFRTKAEAKAEAERQYGKLTPNNKLDSLIEGW